MRSEIMLIGPPRVGKSTVGKLLAEKLNLPQCSLDALRWRYYKAAGYNAKVAQAIADRKGFWGLFDYWKLFDAPAIEQLLAENSNCVFDTGSGHTVFEDEILFRRVQQSLAPFKNLVLLLPSPDPETSIQILNERITKISGENITLSIAADSEAEEIKLVFKQAQDFKRQMQALTEYFVKHPANRMLAKFVVYTKDKTPQQVCTEILDLVQL